mmetsp:Transcript_17043/g.36819  ORF Transcript_17043/g.36819 Transcript_17043/m.36819 type:complete len:221 (-) Transcript_17043:601-1263(-)
MTRHSRPWTRGLVRKRGGRRRSGGGRRSCWRRARRTLRSARRQRPRSTRCTMAVQAWVRLGGKLHGRELLPWKEKPSSSTAGRPVGAQNPAGSATQGVGACPTMSSTACLSWTAPKTTWTAGSLPGSTTTTATMAPMCMQTLQPCSSLSRSCRFRRRRRAGHMRRCCRRTARAGRWRTGWQRYGATAHRTSDRPCLNSYTTRCASAAALAAGMRRSSGRS